LELFCCKQMGKREGLGGMSGHWLAQSSVKRE
jgi:hypothetical protein